MPTPPVFTPNPAPDPLTLEEAAAHDGTYGSGSDSPAIFALGGIAFDFATETQFMGSDPAQRFRLLHGTTALEIVS